MSRLMHRNKTVMAHNFSMVPRSDIPRSAFRRPSSWYGCFDAGDLIPCYVREVLPGDSFNTRMTAFIRLTTPIFPFFTNVYVDSFFFFVPNRLVQDNWVKLMGEQKNPSDSISFMVPQCESPTGGYEVGSLQDYMGLATEGQVDAAETVTFDNLVPRGYNLIWNEWFRDENLQNSAVVDVDDGPDTYTDYVLRKRGKRFDYFTSCLPWPQKGNTAVSLPLGTSAPVLGIGVPAAADFPNAVTGIKDSANNPSTDTGNWSDGGDTVFFKGTGATGAAKLNIRADLSAATAATINAIRTAITVQQFLERDARGGTRYTEILQSRFGVLSPDARLQRPEYLGGGSSPLILSPIAQSSGTNAEGTTTPLGNLAAAGTALATHGFVKSFVEHGHVIGMISIRADLIYQQGVKRMWFRQTRYDFYDPVFANIGEQSVLMREIYMTGLAADTDVWGYQEPWAEYRYEPSLVTGQMRSTFTTPLDRWHLAQYFETAPALNDAFIQENPPIERVVAVGEEAEGQQFYADISFDERVARPMPMYGVPGLTRF